MGKGSIKMTTTTDHTEIRNSVDDDVRSDFLGILTHLTEENASLTAEVERLSGEVEAGLQTEKSTNVIVRGLLANLRATVAERDDEIERLRHGVEVETAPAAQCIWDFKPEAEEES